MNILTKIEQEGLLFDGAMGSMIINAGLNTDFVSDFWNIENPEAIQKIHAAYIEAGADIVTTNTFGASRIKLKKADLHLQVEEINKNAVKIARQSGNNHIYVAGDLGPTGEMLAPFGLVSYDEVKNNFAEQAEFLQAAGVDVFIIETMFDLNEALAALQGVRSVSDLPVISTMTFEYKNEKFNTMMGNSPMECFAQLRDNGANVVGANCSLGSPTMVLLSEIMKKNDSGLTIIQPNAGMPETIDGRLVYPETVTEYADNILKIKKNGINIVGGCCGTTPEYIKAIKEGLTNR
jgi:methionine synthase I (cobalamin-dependent)